MEKMHHKCENCDSEYTIVYDEDKVDDSPKYCGFCGEYIVNEESELDFDEEYLFCCKNKTD
jgi:hypothetical protein